ncbi:MAG TPA: molybdopterin synthase sulfur carrier subunit [Campylobacterales bacterium]|nr:molybdopterin synthase sulfur carrier subunit [Campylobacterales bacterium]
MAIVEFLGPIGKKPMEVDIKSLSELKGILSHDNELSSWLENSAIAINDELVNTLEVQIKSSDKISLLPPVCGG